MACVPLTIWYRWCTTTATSVVGMFILAWHDKRLAYLSRSCRKKCRPVMATRDLSIAATVVQSVHRTAENPKRTRRAGTAGPAGQATRRCAVNTGNTQHQHPLPMATTRLSPLRAEERPGVGTPNLTENSSGRPRQEDGRNDSGIRCPRCRKSPVRGGEVRTTPKYKDVRSYSGSAILPHQMRLWTLVSRRCVTIAVPFPLFVDLEVRPLHLAAAYPRTCVLRTAC